VCIVQVTCIPDSKHEDEPLPRGQLVDSNLFVFEKIKPSHLPANQ